MNGFTTTEPKRDATDRKLLAERVAMAMAEAGCPAEVGLDGGLIYWSLLEGDEDDETLLKPRAVAFAKALDLLGVTRRCLPCSLAVLHTDRNSSARVSPDCEGTGRCGSAE